MRRSWKMWLIVGLALVALTEGVGLLLAAQGSPGVAQIVRSVGRIAANAWVIYGLILWREVPWVRRFGFLLLGSAAFVMLILVLLAMGWTDMVTASVGAYAMAMTFYAGLWLIRILLSPGFAVFGVARTLVDESIRMKIALVFIIGVAILIAIFPFIIDQEDFLKYRITSFLTWSLMATSALLSLMTLFLAIGTITKEQAQRQIFLTLTKPVNRAEYLFGKWLGITLINLLLLTVAGAGIYSFTMLLEAQPARDATDRLSVESQVLVARQSVEPVPPDPAELQTLYHDLLQRLRDDDPERYGEPGDPPDKVSDADNADIQQKVMLKWFTIPNLSSKVYRFNGLEDAKRYPQPLQLRFKPKLAGSALNGFVYLGLRINGRPYYQPGITTGQGLLKLAENNFHVLNIDPNEIDEAGGLTIEIYNPKPGGRRQPALSFNPKDGVEVLYRVGEFEGNLVRTLGVIWMRLMFLAMLGLAAGAYLSFPVATMVCLLVYFTAAGNTYLAESMQYYAAFPKAAQPFFQKVLWLIARAMELVSTGKYYDLFKMVVKLIGSGFMLVTPSFADLNPTPLVSDGRLVPTGMVAHAVIWSAGVWTGFVGLIGWLIFRSRELARVTV
jgi:ABC-2 family transporter protein